MRNRARSSIVDVSSTCSAVSYLLSKYFVLRSTPYIFLVVQIDAVCSGSSIPRDYRCIVLVQQYDADWSDRVWLCTS